jgi:hypothetical protein
MPDENTPDPSSQATPDDNSGKKKPRPREAIKHEIRPSYVEGLQAINTSDLPDELRDALQLDHSSEYMERKFREWQQQQETQGGAARDFSQLPEDGSADLTALAAALSLPKRTDRDMFPYKGVEFSHLSKCAQASSKVWKNAYLSFTTLRDRLPFKDASVLMKAIVLNELQFYTPKTVKRDADALGKVIPASSLESLGFSQMTPKAVHDLENGLIGGKKVRPEYTQLTYFFSTRGHSGEGHEARALLDPTCVPMIVAAKLESLVEVYDRTVDKFSAKPMRIDLETLAYGYKPDVFWNPKDIGDPNFHAVTSAEQALNERIKGYELLFPCAQKLALSKSVHLANVGRWVVRLNEPV